MLHENSSIKQRCALLPKHVTFLKMLLQDVI